MWRSQPVLGESFETKGDVSIGGLLFIVDCLIRQGKLDEAEKELVNYLRGLDEWRPDLKDEPYNWTSDKLMGDIHLRRGHIDLATASYKEAVQKVEKLRSQLHGSRSKITYAAAREELYDSLINCLLEQENYIEAFNYSERARARAFLDLMSDKSIRGTNPEAEPILTRREEIINDLLETEAAAAGKKDQDKSEFFRSLAGQREELAAVEREIGKQYPELASLISVEALTARAVQNTLDEDLVLVEYYLFKEQVVVWLVGKDIFKGVQIPVSSDEIKSLVITCRKQLGQTMTDDPYSAGARLYGLLFEPVEEDLNPGIKLCIVPHGILHYLPFQVLHKEGRYVIEDFKIFYAPSASVYDICRKKSVQKEMTLFAMGNPDYKDPSLAIPFAEEEVMTLLELYPDARVYTGSNADRFTYFEHATDYKLVHLATHGVYNHLNPMRSGLLLAGDTEDKRLVTAEHIFESRLEAYLVTLSACQTALGKMTGGDELIGLTRAFLYAGTPSVVSSLWSVNDRATSYFMVSFYTHLKTLDKASALQKAQLDTMSVYPEPFFWGAFVLNGYWY
jgi:CHAT domain-containing protein